MQAPATADDQTLRAAIARADAALVQHSCATVAATAVGAPSELQQQQLPAMQDSGAPGAMGPDSPSSRQQEVEEDWLQRMQRADAALRAAIQQADAAAVPPD